MAPYASLRRTEVGCRPMKSKVSTVSEGTEDRTDELVTNFLASNLRVDVRKRRVELMGHPIMIVRFDVRAAIHKQLATTIGPSPQVVHALPGNRPAQGD